MDIQLTPTIYVQYKATASRRGLKALLLMSPVWALWAPVVAGWLAVTMTRGGNYSDGVMWASLVACIGLTAMSFFSVFVCRQNNIELTTEGIRFPTWCLLDLKLLQLRQWKEIIIFQVLKFAPS